MSAHGKHGLHAVIGKHIFVPRALFHAFEVNGSEAAVDAVDGDFARREADDGAKEDMEVVDVRGVGLREAVGEDVEAGDGGGPVGVGNAGERGEEGGVEDVIVDEEKEEGGEGKGGDYG